MNINKKKLLLSFLGSIIFCIFSPTYAMPAEYYDITVKFNVVNNSGINLSYELLYDYPTKTNISFSGSKTVIFKADQTNSRTISLIAYKSNISSWQINKDNACLIDFSYRIDDNYNPNIDITHANGFCQNFTIHTTISAPKKCTFVDVSPQDAAGYTKMVCNFTVNASVQKN